MAAKQLAFDQETQRSILAGVEKLAGAVRSTFGPRGRTAVLDKGWGAPTVTKDGVTVAEEIELKDKYENMAVQLIKEAASKTSDVAGDGTTTATVLAEAVYKAGLKMIVAGFDPNGVNRGIEIAVGCVIDELKNIARPVQLSKREDIINIAAISANNDRAIGEMMANAFEKVGKDGVITVEEGKTLETDVDVVEGMQFDRGYLSPHFVTNPDEMEVEFEKPLVLVFEEKVSAVQKLVPLLEKVAQTKRPLLIIAEDIEGEALATLVVNKLRGILQVAAVKAPGYGDRRKAMLEDIAVLTGAKPIFKDLGIDLEKVGPLVISARPRRSRSTRTTRPSSKAPGSSADIQGRIEQIRREIEDATSDYDREKLQERLAKLAGGVAQINVGAATESELKEKKARIEDALHATRAAIEEGIVPGGGVALVRCLGALDKPKAKAKGEDEKAGVKIIRDAMDRPDPSDRRQRRLRARGRAQEGRREDRRVRLQRRHGRVRRPAEDGRHRPGEGRAQRTRERQQRRSLAAVDRMPDRREAQEERRPRSPRHGRRDGRHGWHGRHGRHGWHGWHGRHGDDVELRVQD